MNNTDIIPDAAFDAAYRADFARFIRRYPRPLPFERFVALEMEFYRQYRQDEKTAHHPRRAGGGIPLL